MSNKAQSHLPPSDSGHKLPQTHGVNSRGGLRGGRLYYISYLHFPALSQTPPPSSVPPQLHCNLLWQHGCTLLYEMPRSASLFTSDAQKRTWLLPAKKKQEEEPSLAAETEKSLSLHFLEPLRSAIIPLPDQDVPPRKKKKEAISSCTGV